MSLKMKQIIKNIIKISTFSLIFILWIFFISNYINADDKIENKTIKTKPNNNANYKNIVITPIANVAVAITSNIWIWKNKNSKIVESQINNKIFNANDFYLNTNEIKNSIIKSNMIFTVEYLNILKINFNSVLKKSKNRKNTLNNIINQLQIRYKNANDNTINLNKQNSILTQEYDKITLEIEKLKNELELDFTNSNTQKVFNKVDKYYELKNKQIILKTNIIFINEFIKRYNYLNKYNKLLLDTLIDNKDIISKDSYIVIPSSWDQLLKDFDLIFTEQEYKENKKTK